MIKLLKIKILIFAFTLPLGAFGQFIEGKIIDKDTGQGLDYVCQ